MIDLTTGKLSSYMYNDDQYHGQETKRRHGKYILPIPNRMQLLCILGVIARSTIAGSPRQEQILYHSTLCA